MAYELKKQWIVKGKFKNHRDGQNFKVPFDKYPLDNELVDLIINYRDFRDGGYYTSMSDVIKIKVYEEYTFKTVDSADLDYRAIVDLTRPPEPAECLPGPHIPTNSPEWDDLPF